MRIFVVLQLKTQGHKFLNLFGRSYIYIYIYIGWKIKNLKNQNFSSTDQATGLIG